MHPESIEVVTQIKKALRNAQHSSQNSASKDWHTKTAFHWLQLCREHALPGVLLKTAELGGGADTPFEQAFANLAHSYL